MRRAWKSESKSEDRSADKGEDTGAGMGRLAMSMKGLSLRGPLFSKVRRPTLLPETFQDTHRQFLAPHPEAADEPLLARGA